MKKIAISIGDLNGIGLEIALRNHDSIKKQCSPIYCIDKSMLEKGSHLLDTAIPEDFECYDFGGESFDIAPGKVCNKAGEYSYRSFMSACELALKKRVDAIVTLPIHKEAWAKAQIPFVGHTDALRKFSSQEPIMMLGCEKLFTILYTHHIPLKDVAPKIGSDALSSFLIRVHKALHVQKYGVLGLNPHAGDNGLIGDEDAQILKAIENVNTYFNKELFIGPLVPDTAFTKRSLSEFNYFICMYHDQGLIPLKSLFFEESINVSLDCGIIRTSVDHGTAFDIAYKKSSVSSLSYINAVKEAVNLSLSN